VSRPLVRLAIYVQLKNLPVHRTMLEISELIYETCKTYLVTQGKFIMLLWPSSQSSSRSTSAFCPGCESSDAVTLPIILLFSLVGIAAATAWPGWNRVNTFATRAPHSPSARQALCHL